MRHKDPLPLHVACRFSSHTTYPQEKVHVLRKILVTYLFSTWMCENWTRSAYSWWRIICYFRTLCICTRAESRPRVVSQGSTTCQSSQYRIADEQKGWRHLCAKCFQSFRLRYLTTIRLSHTNLNTEKGLRRRKGGVNKYWSPPYLSEIRLLN